MSNQGDGWPPQGDSEGQWSGGQPPWTGGQPSQQPSWSTDRTGPNVGPTMHNPQSSYYDRFSEASGEGITGPQPSGGGGRGKVLIGLAAAVVLIVAAVAIFALTRGDDSPQQAARSGSTRSLQPVKATTWTNPTLGVGARALKDGWQSQSARSDALRGRYDVPKTKDWKVRSNTYSIIAYGADGRPVAGAGGISEYKLGFCSVDKKMQSAWVGIRGVGAADPTEAGPTWAEKFAKGIAAGKDPAEPGEVSDAKQVKVNDGTIPALQYTVTTESGQPNKCDKGKKYEVRTTTFSAAGKSYQLVSVRLLGVDQELPAAQLDEIISTFRPAD